MLNKHVISVYYNNFYFFKLKNTQNDGHKKDHLVDVDKSIWICQHDWVVKLDPIVLIDRIID